MNATDGAAGIPAVYMRGGTSKGVFLHAADIPAAGAERDALLLRLMGSPDPLQIDGMGGTYSSTSKVVIVEPGPGAAVTYWFAQIGIDAPTVDWAGNCGNLTTAVAPFAIDEGLVQATGSLTSVHLINGNTGVHIVAEVPTVDGRAATTGTHSIAGVPGTGAPVVTRYLDPTGGVLGHLFPLGGPTTRIDIDGVPLTVTLMDAAHPNLIVRAEDVGLQGDVRTVAELNSDHGLRARVERIRAAASVRLRRASAPEEAARASPAIPRIVVVERDAEGADLRAIAFSMGAVHRGLPMTGALCLAAAGSVAGTVVAELVGGPRESVRVRHPLGITEAVAETDGDGRIRSLGVVRTARRLMDGRVYPRDLL